jgi:hypothetical protein
LRRPLQLDDVVPSLDQLLRDPEPLQDFERAWLHCECARLMHAIELPVDDPDASAERVQLGRKGEPCRARADDKDVRIATRCHGSVHRTGSVLRHVVPSGSPLGFVSPAVCRRRLQLSKQSTEGDTFLTQIVRDLE